VLFGFDLFNNLGLFTMAMFKIYVGNLDYKVTAELLKPLFEPFGELDEITIAVDADGKSRGFAIVLFKDKLKGQLAIETLAEKKVLGRPILITEALKKGKKLKPEVKKPEVRQGPFGPKFRPDGAKPMGGPGSRSGVTPRLGGAGGSRPTSSRNPRRASGAAGGSGFRPTPGGAPSGPGTGGTLGGPRSFPSGNVRPPRPLGGSSPSAPESRPSVDPKPKNDLENK
jgi:RNA recognition motif-containing protein